jgi:hypothetical protein
MEAFCKEFGLESLHDSSLLETYLKDKKNVILDLALIPEESVFDTLSVILAHKNKMLIVSPREQLDRSVSFTIYQIASDVFNTNIKNDDELSNCMNQDKEEIKQSFSTLSKFEDLVVFIFNAQDLPGLHWKFIHGLMDSHTRICIVQDSSQNIFK